MCRETHGALNVIVIPTQLAIAYDDYYFLFLAYHAMTPGQGLKKLQLAHATATIYS